MFARPNPLSSYVCLLALLVHALLSCSRAHAAEKRFPAANDIFTIGMVSLDHIDKCGVNVLGWCGSLQRPEQRKWFARCVDFAKRHQMPVIMGLSIFNAEWETYEQRPELVATCCKDIEGNNIIVGWGETQSPDQPMYWGCTNNPAYRQFWIEVAKNNVDLGAQGFIADEMQGTSGVIWHDGGCYCEHCEKGFREFLRKNCDAETLKKHGIERIDEFSYRDLVRSKASTKREELIKLVQRGKLPLLNEYTRYQQLASREYLRQLVRETKLYAQEKYGRSITFSANTYDLAPETAYYLDLLDYFSVETPYVRRYRYPPHRRVLPYFRISQALGKPSIALLCIRSGADFNQRGGLPNLQCLHIAEAYASGNNTFVPDNVYAWSEATGSGYYVGDLDAMAPVCRFIRGSDFYAGSRPWGAKIALLYLTDSALKSWHYWNSFTGGCWLLDDAHLPFDVVISGDGELVKQKLDLAKLQRYDAILLTGGAQPCEHGAAVIQKYVQAGGRALWLGGDRKHTLAPAGTIIKDGMGAKRFEGDKTQAAGEFAERLGEAASKVFEFRGPSTCTVLPRILPNGTIVVHLLNFDYDVNADFFRPTAPSVLRIKPDRNLGQLKVALLTPQTSKAGVLEVRSKEGWLEVNVPEFDAYGVLLMGEQGFVEDSVKKTEHAMSRPLVQPKKMKIDRDARDWAAIAPKLPHGIKVAFDDDGLYFYVPSEDPRKFQSALFEIDSNGDSKPDMGYYTDRWGGTPSKWGPKPVYMGRGRAARCERGWEFKIPGSALPPLERAQVRMTRLNGEKQDARWEAF